MAIPEKKKRYMVTLTPSNVERFQSLRKQLGMPPSTMSCACDDAIDTISNTFQAALNKGSLDLSDLFKVMGQQLELLEVEDKQRKEKKNVPVKKSNTVPNRKKSA